LRFRGILERIGDILEWVGGVQSGYEVDHQGERSMVWDEDITGISVNVFYMCEYLIRLGGFQFEVSFKLRFIWFYVIRQGTTQILYRLFFEVCYGQPRCWVSSRNHFDEIKLVS